MTLGRILLTCPLTLAVFGNQPLQFGKLLVQRAYFFDTVTEYCIVDHFL